MLLLCCVGKSLLKFLSFNLPDIDRRKSMNSKRVGLQITWVVFIFTLHTIHDWSTSTVTYCSLLSAATSPVCDLVVVVVIRLQGGERGLEAWSQCFKIEAFLTFTRKRKKSTLLKEICGFILWKRVPFGLASFSAMITMLLLQKVLFSLCEPTNTWQRSDEMTANSWPLSIHH